MAHVEVQGIVSVQNGLPFVQFRQIGNDGEVQNGWQLTPAEAREFAQSIVEASMNAVYDAALIGWANEVSPDDDAFGIQMVSIIRKYRADIWGLPDLPEDWRPNE